MSRAFTAALLTEELETRVGPTTYWWLRVGLPAPKTVASTNSPPILDCAAGCVRGCGRAFPETDSTLTATSRATISSQSRVVGICFPSFLGDHGGELIFWRSGGGEKGMVECCLFQFHSGIPLLPG